MKILDHPVTTKLPRQLIRDLKREAKLNRLKMYQIFEEALRMWLASREGKRAA